MRFSYLAFGTADADGEFLTFLSWRTGIALQVSFQSHTK